MTIFFTLRNFCENAQFCLKIEQLLLLSHLDKRLTNLVSGSLNLTEKIPLYIKFDSKLNLALLYNFVIGNT